MAVSRLLYGIVLYTVHRGLPRYFDHGDLTKKSPESCTVRAQGLRNVLHQSCTVPVAVAQSLWPVVQAYPISPPPTLNVIETVFRPHMSRLLVYCRIGWTLARMSRPESLYRFHRLSFVDSYRFCSIPAGMTASVRGFA